MQYLLPIDIGTTSTKILAVSATGKTLQKVEKTYPTLHPQAGWAEQDPEQLLEAMLNGITEVIGKMGEPPLAVSFSCAMHSLILMDKGGKPLTRAILWSDTRSRKQAELLKESGTGTAIYQATGTPVHAMSPLCKLIWFRENHPELLQQAEQVIDLKGYFLYRLFGQYLIDYSMASATGLMAVQQKVWHSPAVALAGISTEQLPRLVPTDYQLQGLPTDFCLPTGLTPDTPFVIGASDGCLANLGALALDRSALAITLGTSGAIRTGNPQPFIHPEGKTFWYHLDDQFYINGGATNNGGNVFAWVQQTFFTGLSSEAVLTKLQAIPPGSEGLLALPWLHGERAPLWEEQASGAFIGLRAHHSSAHLGRAALEGLILNIYSIYHDLKKMPNCSVEEIRVNGGLARSPLVRQIIADVFGLPVHLLTGTDGSALGAAMLALKALGKVNDYQEFHPWIHTTSLTLPIPDQQILYQQRFAIFQPLYQQLATVMKRL